LKKNGAFAMQSNNTYQGLSPAGAALQARVAALEQAGAGPGPLPPGVSKYRALTQGTDYALSQGEYFENQTHSPDQNSFNFNWPNPTIRATPAEIHLPGTVISDGTTSSGVQNLSQYLESAANFQLYASIYAGQSQNYMGEKIWHLENVTFETFTGTDGNPYTKGIAAGAAPVFDGNPGENLELTVAFCCGYDLKNNVALGDSSGISYRFLIGSAENLQSEFSLNITKLEFTIQFDSENTGSVNFTTGVGGAWIYWRAGVAPGDVVASGSAHYQYNYEQTQPDQLGQLTNLMIMCTKFTNEYGSVSGEAEIQNIETENVCFEDGETIKAVIVRGIADAQGAKMQVEMAVGYDIEHPEYSAYDDYAYYKITLLELNFENLTSDYVELNGVSWTMPEKTVNIPIGRYVSVHLNEDFVHPESFLIAGTLNAGENAIFGFMLPEVFRNRLTIEKMSLFLEPTPDEIDMEGPQEINNLGANMVDVAVNSFKRQIVILFIDVPVSEELQLSLIVTKKEVLS
jgi:hypothetical protein